jgi:hypothetical protein
MQSGVERRLAGQRGAGRRRVGHASGLTILASSMLGLPADRLGLPRIVGPVYQFRHAALQDHLAPPAETTPATVFADLSTITG